MHDDIQVGLYLRTSVRRPRKALLPLSEARQSFKYITFVHIDVLEGGSQLCSPLCWPMTGALPVRFNVT